MAARFLEAQHPDRGRLLACIDESVRFVAGKVADGKLAALLAPFRSDEEAEAALREAGASVVAPRAAASN